MNKKIIYISIASCVLEIEFEYFPEKKKRFDFFWRAVNYQYQEYIIKNPSHIDGTITIVFSEDTYKIYTDKDTNVSYIPFCQEISNTSFITYYHVSIVVFKQLVLKLVDRILAKAHGFVLHSSAVVLNSEAIIFLAPSGGGKSTLAKIARKNLISIADDTILIKKTENCYYAYVLPDIDSVSLAKRFKKTFHKRFKINKLFFINKKTKLQIDSQISLETAQRLFLNQILTQELTRKKSILNGLDFFATMYRNIQVLYFPKNIKEAQLIDLLNSDQSPDVY